MDRVNESLGDTLRAIERHLAVIEDVLTAPAREAAREKAIAAREAATVADVQRRIERKVACPETPWPYGRHKWGTITLFNGERESQLIGCVRCAQARDAREGARVRAHLLADVSDSIPTP